MELLNFVYNFVSTETAELIFKAVYVVFITFLFVKGEISMSKYAQMFTNLEYRFTPSNDNKAVLDVEPTDLQEEMNSHKDDCLSVFLDKYLDFSSDVLPFAVDQLADGEYDMLNSLVGTNADKVLSAYDNLMAMRERYNIPDKFSNEELVAYLRELANGKEVAENEETQIKSQSEPQKLSQNDEKDA